ncbi:MAG: hypothetical protein LBC19_05180 [Tannerella sp.]|jgi:hypothetical protein|nr:hypothetical protein [Tannerella sp.]
MKKIILSVLFTVAAMEMGYAQQIAVVSSQNVTALYTDLNRAIQEASGGSSIYLSGGGFQINDSAKITKKLTIIGIGHRPDNDHADKNTIVSGNLFFEGGSDGSAVMGIYLSGNIYIGTGSQAVNTLLVRYCNANAVEVRNSNCQRIQINQNYLRGGSNGGGSSVAFTNNILNSAGNINGGVVNHNVITGGGGASNSQVKDNIFLNGNFSSSVTSHNMSTGSVGDNCVVVTDWAEILEGPNNGVSPTSNYHLKGNTGKGVASDGTDIGIYGGTGFKDSALPPIHRIVFKSVADRTDENGKLPIQLQIKAKAE